MVWTTYGHVHDVPEDPSISITYPAACDLGPMEVGDRPSWLTIWNRTGRAAYYEFHAPCGQTRTLNVTWPPDPPFLLSAATAYHTRRLEVVIGTPPPEPGHGHCSWYDANCTSKDPHYSIRGFTAYQNGSAVIKFEDITLAPGDQYAVARFAWGPSVWKRMLFPSNPDVPGCSAVMEILDPAGRLNDRMDRRSDLDRALDGGQHKEYAWGPNGRVGWWTVYINATRPVAAECTWPLRVAYDYWTEDVRLLGFDWAPDDHDAWRFEQLHSGPLPWDGRGAPATPEAFNGHAPVGVPWSIARSA